MPALKGCSSCKIVKPQDEKHFAKTKKGRTGLTSQCRSCRSAYLRNYLVDYQKKNFDKLKAYNSDYRADRKDIIRQKDRDRATKSRPYRTADIKRWCVENIDRVRKSKRASEHRRRAKKFEVPGSHKPMDVIAIKEKQGNLCFYCSVSLGAYHVDHFIPLSRGGPNGRENLVISCARCNLSKHSKMPWEWMPQRFLAGAALNGEVLF